MWGMILIIYFHHLVFPQAVVLRPDSPAREVATTPYDLWHIIYIHKKGVELHSLRLLH